MTPGKKTLLISVFTFLTTMLTQINSYMTGIHSQGGSWDDMSTFTIATYAVTALGAVGGTILALLSDPPPGKQILPNTLVKQSREQLARKETIKQHREMLARGRQDVRPPQSPSTDFAGSVSDKTGQAPIEDTMRL